MEQNDVFTPDADLGTIAANLEALGKLAPFARYLQSSAEIELGPEKSAEAEKHFYGLLNEMSKFSKKLFSVLIYSRELGSESLDDLSDGTFGPAPLAEVNNYLRSVEAQHKLLGAETAWRAVGIDPDEEVSPSWMLEVRYDHILIALGVFEYEHPDKDQGAD